MKVTALYICYWSLKDPLCQSQSLAYLRRLLARGHRFALMTFEQDAYRVGADEAARVRRELADEGIYWYPLTYHKRLPLAATAFDCLCGVLAGIWITFRCRPRVVHSRASIPGVIGLLLSRLCGLKFLYDADSRLSEEYADNGHWSRDGLAFRLTAWFERNARDSADSIVTLTERLREDFLNEFEVRAPIDVIPCCVDLEKFDFNEEARTLRRRQLGLADETLFVYVGKIGPRYLLDEMLQFFRTIRGSLHLPRLLIISGESPDLFHEAARRAGVRSEDYSVVRASHDQVAAWLSAADVGLAFIRSANCERGSSPVKIGEYLAVGLPVAITSGVGDYSELIEARHAGVMLKEHTEEAHYKAAEQLKTLLTNCLSLRQRIRAVAESSVSLESVGATRYEAAYARILKGTNSLLEPIEESR